MVTLSHHLGSTESNQFLKKHYKEAKPKDTKKIENRKGITKFLTRWSTKARKRYTGVKIKREREKTNYQTN